MRFVDDGVEVYNSGIRDPDRPRLGDSDAEMFVRGIENDASVSDRHKGNARNKTPRHRATIVRYCSPFIVILRI